MDKNQQKRYSKAEISLIKATFRDREDILLAVRNLFFGFELEESEKQLIIKTFSSPELRRLMRKHFLPELDRNVPIGQSIDLWMTVNLQNLEEFLTVTEGRKQLIEVLNLSLELLENPEAPKLPLEIPEVISHPHLIARNTFIAHIEKQLLALKMLADEVELTPEQKAKKQKQDSSL